MDCLKNKNQIRRIVSSLIFLLLFLPIELLAFRSLVLSPDARSIGLAGAFVGIADNIQTIHYNAAGIANISNFQIMFSYQKLSADVNYAYLSGIAPIKYGSIGYSMGFFNMGDFPVFFQGMETGENIGARDFFFIFTYAKNIYKDFKLGGNIKFVNSNIADASTFNTAFDFGCFNSFYFKSGEKNLSFGLSIANIGFKSKYGKSQSGQSLPLTLRYGLAYRLQRLLILSLEYENEFGFKPGFYTGIEFFPKWRIRPRCGLKFNEKIQLTAGIGINYNISSTFNIQVDYAFLHQFDDNHFVSLTIIPYKLPWEKTEFIKRLNLPEFIIEKEAKKELIIDENIIPEGKKPLIIFKTLQELDDEIKNNNYGRKVYEKIYNVINRNEKIELKKFNENIDREADAILDGDLYFEKEKLCIKMKLIRPSDKKTVKELKFYCDKEKAGYEIFDIADKFSDGFEENFIYSLFGSLSISVKEPLYARVFINDKLQGTNSFIERWLVKGDYKIRIEKEGYFPIEEIKYVKPVNEEQDGNRFGPVILTEKPKLGNLVINAYPETKYKIHYNYNFVGSGTVLLTNIPACKDVPVLITDTDERIVRTYLTEIEPWKTNYINYFSEYKEEFTMGEYNKNLWNKIIGDESIKIIKSSTGLRFVGTNLKKDTCFGIISDKFEINVSLPFEIEFEYKINKTGLAPKYFIGIGFIDKINNAYFVHGSDSVFSVQKWINNENKTSDELLNITVESKQTHKIKIKYERDGITVKIDREEKEDKEKKNRVILYSPPKIAIIIRPLKEGADVDCEFKSFGFIIPKEVP